MFVYLISCSKTNKQYVGQTKVSLYDRLAQHCDSQRTGPTLLKQDIQKHGSSYFTISLLQKCASKEELDSAESYWIEKLNTIKPNGYNTKSGKGGSRKTKNALEDGLVVKSGAGGYRQGAGRKKTGKENRQTYCQALKHIFQKPLTKNYWGSKM